MQVGIKYMHQIHLFEDCFFQFVSWLQPTVATEITRVKKLPPPTISYNFTCTSFSILALDSNEI